MKTKTKITRRKQSRTRKHSAHKASVTVVIPVLNESRTIGNVVKFALRDPRVAEVLVVDDGSIDGTPERAERAGARVVTSSLLGKGASMEDGLQAAHTEFLLYLDGDLRGLRHDLIHRMTRPLIVGASDFAKARFARRAGRVTVLTAKPLLRTYFPELADLVQPLGGIMAARRTFLQQLRFENDYGVDIGLLIDAAAARARIVEVDIGRIEHRSQSLEALGEMATQVARTILERAAEWGRLRIRHVRAAKERDRVQRADFRHALNMLKRAEKLALFDMDGTLLNGRFVLELAHHTGRMELLNPLLDNLTIDAITRTRRIAAIFARVPKSTIEQVARQMPLMPGAVETVVGLRKAGYLVGVVTDSYRMAAEMVRRRVFADFTISHVMKFHHEKATGRLTLSPAMQHPKGCPEHRLCKLNVLQHLLDELGIGPERVLAVGDSDNDVCLLRAAGISVAFQPKTPAVRDAARHVVQHDLRGILRLLGQPVSSRAEIRQLATAAQMQTTGERGT
jgi:glucosyl-3-phosphoglycerate synthase